ncbi:ubiquitin carboxyl-terminal hydrolase 36 isoform X2 [Aplysia californica]|nr:ubiquitin carboxyl-terminal hydrolase 36 isoform X2 [Aplysia californica]XP_012936911.1 ubiquitin carboxyl-terminal hydrolase 36 isoform X2 [Aplysia californica]
MPDSAGNIEVIQSSLKASLGGRDRDRLDEDVAAASKRVLLHNIEFLPASAPYSIQRDTLRAKYIPLNSAPTQSRPWGDGSTPQHQAMTSSAHSDKNGDSLPSPRVVLYPEEKVKMEWSRMTRIGAGLVNMGNTCFFNSTLQCLTYTAPLVNYCFTNDHREKCKKKDFCMMCEVQDHIRTSLDCGGRSIKPHSMLQKLRCIAKHMKWGRQEDAHEFLRFLVDHLQQSCLHGETKLDRFSKETTVINQIFGGYLRSQVTCLRCQGKSNTFDPFMDLSLDIKGVNTVEDALLKYVKPETLDNDNAYKCPKCKNKVRAQKRFTIQKAPNVLTLQLNRFDFNRHLSGKINRFIRYPEKVNLRNFMSQKQGEPVLYHLYGVVVHSGHSSDHGHYYSYVKSPSKTWYCMNDSSVHQVNANTVFNSDAYVLFYARINRNISAAHSGPNNVHAKNSSPVKVPFSSVMIQNHLKQEKTQMVNGIHGKATSELGTPIKRQQPAGSSLSSSSVANGPKIVPHGTSPSALPGAHNKISFPILTPQQKKQLHLQQQKDDGKRIVLQIKHGNSTTMEKSPDGKSKVVNGGGSNKPAAQLKSSGLVPYNDDSDSEQENNSAGGNSVRLNKSPHHRTTDVASTSSSASGGSYIQASGDHHHHHNYASVRSIPLPSDSGDGHKSGISSTHKTSVSSDMQNLSQTKDGSRSPHVHQMHSQNGIKQSPRSSDTHRWKGSSSPSSSSQHSWVSKKVNAQGNTATTTTTSTTTSSSSALFQASAAGKGGVVALELPPVVNVSSSSSSTPSCSARVKATAGNWLVQPQDCAPSPRGSCSSTNSVNSTTGWTVESKGSSSNGHSSKLQKSDVENGFSNKSFFFSSVTSSSEKIKPTDNDGSSSQRLNTKSEKKDVPRKSLFGLKSPDRKREKKSPFELEVPRTPVDISDTRGLLVSPSSSAASDSGLRKVKKHKKKQKHKDQDASGRDDEVRDDSSSRSDSVSSKKKKKHKHKKVKVEKQKKKYRKDWDSSDSDSSYDKRHTYKKQKRSRCDSDSSDSSQNSKGRNKRASKSSHSEEDYEWVEKTIDTPPPRESFVPYKSKASVQAWNHYVKDDLAPRKNGDHSKLKAQWDGTRVPKIARDIGGSSLTLGNVSSWDGGKNHVDQEIEEEKLSKKRHWSEEYNEELDSGKVKKTKRLKEDHGFNSSYNPFQHHQSLKSGDKHRDASSSSWSQDHSYHQHHDHHYHKKSQLSSSSSSSSHPWRHNDYQTYSKNNSNRFKPYRSQTSTFSY